MQSNWKEFFKGVSKLPPLVLCTLIVILSGILVLIMLYPAAGTALTSFLVTLSLVVERFKDSFKAKQPK